MNRTLIITGGTIDIEFIKNYIRNQSFEYLICVDGGLEIAYQMNLKPSYIVGDFDTVTKSTLDYYLQKATKPNGSIIKRFQPEKDATDSQLAIELAIEIGSEEIVVLGGTGSRIDHVLANIMVLKKPLEMGKKAYLLDKQNKIYLISKKHTITKKSLYGKYISILPYGTQVTKVTLIGFKYPLLNRTLFIGDSLGISNELEEEEGTIFLEDGVLIVIESRD